jgi:murein L,D-transpeptidase YcbB/YkuD
MKLVMPNPYNVYLHDTPSKSLFDRPVRAMSHGCIRVKGAVDFAALLLSDDPTWSRAQVGHVLARGASTKVPLARPLPVYVAYFTAATDAAGKVATFDDIYGRDAPVARGLAVQPRVALSAAGARSDVCPV